MQWASYVAGLLILLGGGACLVLTRRGWRTLPRWAGGQEVSPWLVAPLVLGPVLLGAVVAIGHGAGGGLAKLMEMAGAGTATIHPGAGPSGLVDLRWEVLFYQPWFLAMGICLLLCGHGYLRSAGFSPRSVRLVTGGATALSVASVVLFVLAMTLHWDLDVGI